ncbi:AAA family ATPase [Fulvitalea axinellae]
MRLADSIRDEIGKVIVGQDNTVDLMLTGIFTGGHVLLEGMPGVAKTLAAKMLAKTLSVDFSRVQFTPDLMPSDVLGTMVFNMKDSEFSFKPGPVFSNVVLVDEINRSPAKTQSALFEIMEERQVSIDGTTHKMDYPFFIVATQNPIEQEGTYKLPEAQLDRFLFRIKVGYPELSEEKMILRRFREDLSGKKTHEEVRPIFNAEELKACQEIIENIHIKDELVDYIAELTYKTRHHPDLFLGASPRASLAIMNSSKATAAIRGRDFVTPDDIRFVSAPVLNHRVILTPEREMEGMEVEDVINGIIKQIEVPR